MDMVGFFVDPDFKFGPTNKIHLDALKIKLIKFEGECSHFFAFNSSIKLKSISPLVTGSNPLRVTRGFTWSLTSGPHGISHGAHKLTRTSTVIKKKKKN